MDGSLISLKVMILMQMHGKMAQLLDKVIEEIKAIKENAAQNKND